MNVYEIGTSYTLTQIHLVSQTVVAETMADAERIYRKIYPSATIKTIQLHSEYVLVQGIDDKEKPNE